MKRPGADGVSNLGTVMPDFGELAADIEPLWRRGPTSPGHGKYGVGERVQGLDKGDEILARVCVKLGEDTGTESLGHANPCCVQLVDEERQVPFCLAARTGRGHSSIAMQRQSAQRGVAHMRNDVTHAPN